MNMQLIDFPSFIDERGSLVAIEGIQNIPFEIKRVYYIRDVKQGVRRGFHAHKELCQVLICVNGSCKILLDDGNAKHEFLLDSSNKGLLVGKMVWRQMYDFSPDAVLLVLASEHHEEQDYIRDYEEFLKMKIEGTI